MACDDDFFAALDEAEAKLEAAKETQNEAPKQVRYWFEEGYVEGNEKDSDQESTDNNSEAEAPQPQTRFSQGKNIKPGPEKVPIAKSRARAAAPEKNAGNERAAAEVGDEELDEEEDLVDKDGYHLVRPRARGGRRIRWGGLSGVSSIADAHSETDKEAETVNSLLQKFVPSELQLTQQVGGSSSSTSIPRELAEDVVADQFQQKGASAYTRWSGGGTLSAKSGVDPADLRAHYEQTGGTASSEVRNPAYHETLRRLAAENFSAKRDGLEVTVARAQREAVLALCNDEGRPTPKKSTQAIPPASRSQVAKPRQSSSMLPGSMKGLPPAAPPQVVRGKEIKFVSAHSSSLYHTGPNDVQPDRDGVFRPPTRPSTSSGRSTHQHTDKDGGNELPTWFEYSPGGVQF